MKDLYERFNLNREKVIFLLTLLILGLYSAGKIAGSSGAVGAFEQGLLRNEPVTPMKRGFGEVAGLITEPGFEGNYWDSDRLGPFYVVSDWRVMPPVALEFPALPPLRKVVLPTIPGPGFAKMYLTARDYAEHKVDAPVDEEEGEDEEDVDKPDDAPKRDVRDEEQKKSRFYVDVRKFDKVTLEDGTVHRGLIIEKNKTQLTLELLGKTGMRLPISMGKVKNVVLRISLSEVYDNKLTALAGGDVTNGLIWVKECIQFGFREVAVKHLALMVEKNPTDPRPYLLAGQYYGDAYAYNELASLFMTAAANNVRSSELRWREAKFLARPFNAFYEKALTLYGQAIADLSGSARESARFELADILRKTGELEKAKTIYRDLMGSGEDRARGRAGLCGCLIEQGKLSQALRLLDSEEVTDVRSVELRGVVRLLEGKTAEAITDLLNARSTDPTRYSASYNLALAYLYGGNPEAARREFDAARQMALDDPSMAYLGIGLSHVQQQDPDKALAGSYASALKSNTNTNAMVHFMIGMATIAAKGDQAQVRQSFSNAVRIEFNFAEAHLRLGALALTDGDHIAAQMHLEQAALLQGDATAYAYLGQAFLATKNLDRAVQAYRAGVARDPNSVYCKEGLAYVLNAQNQQTLSQRAFRRIHTKYAKEAVGRIVENQRRRAWTDRFTRRGKRGKVLRKWVQNEEAGVTIKLDRYAVLFDGRQTRVDRMAELHRELPKGKQFVAMAVDIDTSSLSSKAHVGIHLRRGGTKGAAQGGLYFGLTPDGQLFYARYNREQPTQLNEELFTQFKLLGPVKEHVDDKGILRLECVRVGRQNGRFMFLAGGKELLKNPVQINSLIRTRSLRLGVFGTAPEDTAWKLRIDNVQVTSTGGR